MILKARWKKSHLFLPIHAPTMRQHNSLQIMEIIKLFCRAVEKSGKRYAEPPNFTQRNKIASGPAEWNDFMLFLLFPLWWRAVTVLHPTYSHRALRLADHTLFQPAPVTLEKALGKMLLRIYKLRSAPPPFPLPSTATSIEATEASISTTKMFVFVNFLIESTKIVHCDVFFYLIRSESFFLWQ